MNYIKQLQKDTRDMANQINATDYAINEFREFLNSPKFTGVDLDGSRKDWISTDDVLRELLSLRDKLLGIEE